jgi:hypothetical protein
MNSIKIVAITLIVAGALALAYGGFSYTKDTPEVKLGPLELTVKQTKTIDIPVWLGVGSVVLGGLMLALGSNKK